MSINIAFEIDNTSNLLEIDCNEIGIPEDVGKGIFR